MMGHDLCYQGFQWWRVGLWGLKTDAGLILICQLLYGLPPWTVAKLCDMTRQIFLKEIVYEIIFTCSVMKSRLRYNRRTDSWSKLCYTATETLLPRLTAFKTSNYVMDEAAVLTWLSSICYLTFEPPRIVMTRAGREGCRLSYCSSTIEVILFLRYFFAYQLCHSYQHDSFFIWIEVGLTNIFLEWQYCARLTVFLELEYVVGVSVQIWWNGYVQLGHHLIFVGVHSKITWSERLNIILVSTQLAIFLNLRHHLSKCKWLWVNLAALPSWTSLLISIFVTE